MLFFIVLLRLSCKYTTFFYLPKQQAQKTAQMPSQRTEQREQKSLPILPSRDGRKRSQEKAVLFLHFELLSVLL